MRNFYSRKRLKKYAYFLIGIMLINVCSPTISWALTSGPSQPETQSFEPASTTQMVDLFSGDFTYNIPLFELPGPNGGYPFNLAYHSGIGMDQEASWVGLGWSLNPGAINRQMRGLPDEFMGDEIISKKSIKPSVTLGTGMGLGAEIFGGLNVGGGLSVFHNNYKGAGVEADISLSYAASTGGGQTAGLGIGLKANSQQGIGVSPSLSVSSVLKEHDGSDLSSSGSIFVGAGYNSRTGLQDISFGISTSTRETKLVADENMNAKQRSRTVNKESYSSSISLYNPGFSPQVGMPMINSSVNLSFELGGSWWGVYPNMRFHGFYNKQKLLFDKKEIKVPSYGYLHFQDAKEKGALMDFNREKDGVVREENPNLPIPSLTYDIYAATGQGYSAMYRAIRSEVGIIHDPHEVSGSVGFSLGGDVGPALAHVGVNTTTNFSISESGKWEDGNELLEIYKFDHKEINDIEEPVYFKAHGEPTAIQSEPIAELGSDDAIMININKNGKAKKQLKKSDHKKWIKSVNSNKLASESRAPRNSVIKPITNGELKMAGGEQVIDLFKLNYIDSLGAILPYNRNQPDHHIAGFIALTPEGSRYIYALPAYNDHQEEVTYSSSVVTNSARVNVSPANSNSDPNYEVSGTNELLDKKVIPPYAHSYLLTAIVGQDYVDITGDGVSEDDLGYWVNFTYQKTNSKYKWRAPFYKANYFAGLKTTKEDDRASYTYGEKEIWYLKKVETKSHIAEFKISEREDSRGAKYKLQNSSGFGDELSKLDEIVLYTRYSHSKNAGEPIPLKKVKFDYSYGLCKNVENAPAGTGKLTLKRLHFEYGNNSRGSLNPYIFDYHEDNPNENPDYSLVDYDRWGNYKPNNSTDHLKNQEYPYVDQSESKELHDVRSGAWSLKEITLPSGGHMMVDYESDDYAYVQDRTAMQMLELVDPETKSESGVYNLEDGNLKMCFKLAKPINVETNQDSIEAAKPFFETDRDMLYFKMKMNLKRPADDKFDFISTYVSIDQSETPYLSKGPSGDYEYGYFYVKAEQGFHPLSLRAWQHLKINQRDLASSAEGLDKSDNDSAITELLKSLASIIPQMKQMFTGFNDFARNHNWGREVELGKSWVRLLVPDKIKYGGGHRVKQITFMDNWSEDNEGIYGQVYDYSKVDEDTGKRISSGVAAYEPIIGGDENPVRYAKKYTQNIPLASNNTLFFEYPINEGYFPSPKVGYSNVTVMSLASASAAGMDVLHNEMAAGIALFPQGNDEKYGTTGKTVNEFYTAKDFPVWTDETVKDDEPDKHWVPMFPLGTKSAKELTSSQGYSIVTNDMHGKVKKVSHYAQSADGEFAEKSFSWVEYHYMKENLFRNRQQVNQLYNLFVDNGDGTLSKAMGNPSDKPMYHMGQETELFADMRWSYDKSYYGGASVNVDVVIVPILFALVPIPIPTVWPSTGKSEKTLKTAVMNKVIFKSGIVERVEAYNDGSHIVTKNVKWDKLTGRPVLTVVNNNFDNPIYNYEIPAHQVYQGLGAAYENTGYEFDFNSLAAIDGLDHHYEVSLSYNNRKRLCEGDEFVIMGMDSVAIGKGVYLGEVGSSYQIYSEASLVDSLVHRAVIYRSGKRNILSANAGSISALKDPTESSETKTYSIDLLSE